MADSNVLNGLVWSTLAGPVQATGDAKADPAVTTGQIAVQSFVPTVTITLVDNGGSPLPNLTALKWSFFDEATPDILLAPVNQASNGVTDGNGVFSVSTPNSSLNLGEIGYLVVSDTDGTEVQTPAQKAFAGPVVVT
jgi:hypothetical protein